VPGLHVLLRLQSLRASVIHWCTCRQRWFLGGSSTHGVPNREDKPQWLRLGNLLGRLLPGFQLRLRGAVGVVRTYLAGNSFCDECADLRRQVSWLRWQWRPSREVDKRLWLARRDLTCPLSCRINLSLPSGTGTASCSSYWKSEATSGSDHAASKHEELVCQLIATVFVERAVQRQAVFLESWQILAAGRERFDRFVCMQDPPQLTTKHSKSASKREIGKSSRLVDVKDWCLGRLSRFLGILEPVNN
jgi:hypothetical protein